MDQSQSNRRLKHGSSDNQPLSHVGMILKDFHSTKSLQISAHELLRENRPMLNESFRIVSMCLGSTRVLLSLPCWIWIDPMPFCSLKILTKASGADCVGKVRSLVSRTSPNPSLPWKVPSGVWIGPGRKFRDWPKISFWIQFNKYHYFKTAHVDTVLKYSDDQSSKAVRY